MLIKKKSILVEGYPRNNLGDDLFFYILFKRYNNANFYIYYNKRNKSLHNLKNVTIKFDKHFRIIEKITKKSINYKKI